MILFKIHDTCYRQKTDIKEVQVLIIFKFYSHQEVLCFVIGSQL